ncbi:MAG TPA: hypothetical protein VMB71_13510 [Acetobacteraceae bacterium]|nr:hypothetical protein [Acetobacteraceae bacterium]
MTRKFLAAMALVVVGLGLSACVVAGPPGRCGGAGWVRGYYGPGGGWHPGHCR